MTAKASRVANRPPKLIRAADGAHRNGPWSGSVSSEALGTDSFVLFARFEAVGTGPVLHVHPYDEVFVVKSGRALFTIGNESFEAAEGDVAMAPANVPHKFKNLGPGPLYTMDIHLNDEWIQTDLHDPDVA
ncbi:cupin domain-containing protein [Maritimibacter sp. UBA3975]|uniref:cupin domain-containing protein n=1 Tax=Maritimibacter sp. UBA3975 TaxID=1946833 RepID=UPI000C0A8414|nr:cupin domain-containing protein [Maritimibacter sp. UBA3975]MAM60809.1 cupin [Maritimibacter sp.]|tara:strand:- start:18569 stop:18961 length:393 start_codon:yes stop_codon:yes gene_type:complete